jgi:quercetin dioxygenase-like cupin family protein
MAHSMEVSMRSVRLPILIGAVVLLTGAVASSQTATPTQPTHAAHHVVSAKAINWGAAPLPGAQLVVLHGDPGKAGEFVIRIKLPSDAKVPPHWHPTDEHLTVISGTFLIGQGEKFDAAAVKPMVAGDYGFMPKEMRHFALTKGETIVQVSGMGPFVINYVNPQDDPKNKKPSSNQ